MGTDERIVIYAKNRNAVWNRYALFTADLQYFPSSIVTSVLGKTSSPFTFESPPNAPLPREMRFVSPRFKSVMDVSAKNAEPPIDSSVEGRFTVARASHPPNER